MERADRKSTDLRGERGDHQRPAPSPSRRRWWAAFLAVAIGGVVLYWVWTKSGNGQPAAGDPAEGKKGASRAPAPVAAVKAKTSDLELYLDGLGSVTPLNTVTVKSRVDGQLMEIRFQEGQLVKQGDLLGVIDPRPFEVQLTQAEGQMARDQAQVENARLDLERNRKLLSNGDISKQDVDTQEALVRQYEGGVKADQGAIDNARLNLTYSRITSPISGRAGLRLVDPGNIIHSADAAGLVVVTQLQPISVVFTLPEDNIPRLMAKRPASEPLTVEAWDRDLKHKLAEGTLQAVDNQVDSTTGTVRLKAMFPNEDSRLFPNQFVNARLLVEVQRGATVVPAAAILRGPKGTFVYVVGEDQKAEMRPVTVGEIQGGEAAVTSGLASGELVVVDGADRLRNGAPVEVKAPGGGDKPAAGGGAKPKAAGGEKSDGARKKAQ